MQLFFISDTHFGHRNIKRYDPDNLRPGVDVESHDEGVIAAWNAKVPKKRARVYLLGDVAMDDEGAAKLARLNGEIRIILGNHDNMWNHALLPSNCEFEPVSLLKHKGIWYSHCPIHPAEMRKCAANVHGHVHYNDVPDSRYINVCVERCPGAAPISIDELRIEFKKRGLYAEMCD
jgi:calcineurin-like phosphoesterase family protein